MESVLQLSLASWSRSLLERADGWLPFPRAFGEMAIIDRAPRSATIVADSDAECDLLTIEDFEALGQTHPAIKIKLLQNLSLGLCHKLRKANRELSVFD